MYLRIIFNIQIETYLKVDLEIRQLVQLEKQELLMF